jgi:hypothetical protein
MKNNLSIVFLLGFVLFLNFTSYSFGQQDCESRLVDLVKKEYSSSPAEGAKYVNIGDCKYIIGVGISASASKNLSILNRIASVKARRAVVLLLGNPKVTTETFISTEQIVSNDSFRLVEKFLDEIKEEASSFVQGMKTLTSFYSDDKKTYVYVLFRER